MTPTPILSLVKTNLNLRSLETREYLNISEMSYCCKETAHEECENLPVLISVLIGHIKHTQHSNNISDVHGLLSFSLACVEHRATAVPNSTDLN